VAGGQDHDEVGELDVPAAAVVVVVAADRVMELLKRRAAGDHVDDVEAHLHHQLLRHDDPEGQAVTERVLPTLATVPRPAIYILLGYTWFKYFIHEFFFYYAKIFT
jgi:hypothetical protein